MAGKNPINLEVLEMLDAIDRRGSFAKAAEELNKATSALSYGIQKLEEQLDITLFRRQGRRSVLTPAGQLVLDEGRKVLEATVRIADKAREIATGWEPRLRVAVESLQPYPALFNLLDAFINAHAGIEFDISECVLNGGWEALEQDRVDLLIGAPGPVPAQMGFRAVPFGRSDLVPVIAGHHRLAGLDGDVDSWKTALVGLRRIVTHDTSRVGIVRSAGLGEEGERLFVQNIDQKQHAIVAGLGIGHLPRHRVQPLLDSGALVELSLGANPKHDNYLAWKICNKGKGLRALTDTLIAAKWY